MTTDQKELNDTLGSRLIRSLYNQSTVHETVESWNWNMNIFEIYDEVKEWSKNDQQNTLEYAYDYFNKDIMINELHSFLIGWGVEDNR